MVTVVECGGGAKYRRAWALVDERGDTLSVTTSLRVALEGAAHFLVWLVETGRAAPEPATWWAGVREQVEVGVREGFAEPVPF